MKILRFLVLTLLLLSGLLLLILYQGDIPADVVDARYSSRDSQFANLGNLGRVHYRDEGHRRSSPVVLLHGSNSSLHTFEPWVDILEDSYRVITIDLPGHGLTGEIPAEDYSSDSMVSVVNGIADLLGLDQFVIGGNSMGGGIAQRYTLDHPHKISGLVLIDSSGYVRSRYKNDDTQGVLAFRLLRSSWFRRIAEIMDPYYLVAQGVRAAFFDQTVVTEAMIMRYNDLALREGTRRATMQRFAIPRDEKYQAEDLKKINIPTLLMWGKEDAVASFSFTQGYEELIPNTTTAYYDNVGHIPMEEIPEQSAADLITFLEALDES